MRPLLLISAVGTVICYLLAVFSVWPLAALIGCALCGLTVSLMWPGVLSIASARFKGGAIVFALLAFGGDVGCSLGPWITGIVADQSPFGLKAGLLAATVFPFLMILLLLLKRKKSAEA
jgi:fucose permease